MSDLTFASAGEIAAAIQAGEISSTEITQHYINRIAEKDGAINAVVVRTFEQALTDARAADEARARGESLGPLHGVPMTIKESYVLKDTPATWGLEPYAKNISATDGLSVARFKAAGAVFLGKTNVPADLADFQSYNPIYGTTNNPWDTTRAPGGSSGGSSAALAAGFCALEAGSDIGGSIRTPAHFAGVFGHKPTWGIVPQAGHELMPGVPDSDLSVCGPLARSATDLATALDIMAGPWGREAVGWQLNLPKCERNSLAGLRVALWPNDDMAPVSRDISDRVMQMGVLLKEQGATVSDSARPDFDRAKAHETYQNLLSAVMSAAQPNSAVPAMRDHAASFADDDHTYEARTARANIMMHRDWIRHNVRRERLRQAWDDFFADWDVLIAPQFTVPAIPHDHRPFHERTIDVDGSPRPYFEPLFWAGIVIASYLPSTVFPTGANSQGLPIGLQVIGAPYQDHQCIRVADLISRELGGFTPPPDLT